MSAKRVKSWGELNDLLYADSWNERLQRFRPTFAYRGQPDAASELRTRLARLGHGAAKVERHLLRNFRKYARGTPMPDDSDWTWLALAQHHGLPTRLLDWTYSPYVALHFATAHPESFDRDGVIWCVDFAEVHRLVPLPLRKLLREEGSDLFTADILERGTRGLRGLERLSARPFAVFWEAPSLNDRFVNQFALFSMLSDASASLSDWLAKHDCWRQILLPAEMKWEVRDKLDQANITERVLFPGLDGLCRWLTRYYSPRTGGQPS
jgi:hypothetical protein